jgi:hypothetical protein
MNEAAELLRELAHIKKRLDELDAETKALRQRQAQVEPMVLDHFAATGTQRTTVDGITIYLHRQLWAGAVQDKEACYDALVRAGLAEYATKTFNTNAVSALFREWERDGVSPPPELDGVIRVSERYSIRAVRS